MSYHLPEFLPLLEIHGPRLVRDKLVRQLPGLIALSLPSLFIYDVVLVLLDIMPALPLPLIN